MELFRLATPEAVEIEYDIAGIGTRFLATAVDTAISGVLLAIITVGAVALGLLGTQTVTVALILWLTLCFAVVWGYYIFFETVWRGQSPGKRLVKIRVIKTTGYPVGFFEAATRNLVRVVDFLPGLYGVGLTVMFISPQARRLGDYAAGTMVIKERSRLAASDLTLHREQARPLGLSPHPLGASDPDELAWNLSILDASDRAIVTEFLNRAPSLGPDVRGRIGATIADRVAQRIHARAPLDPVRFLERVIYLIDNPD